MEKLLYASMAGVEDRHWWFVARRHILRSLLRRMKLPPGASILEAGCGSGGNFALLQEFGDVKAMELDADARENADKRGLAEAREGSLPNHIPFDESFDLIALLDVLEHLEQDELSLRALHAKLKPGGKLLVTVPAFMFLLGPHDRAHHHFRRYALPQLRDLLERDGFHVSFASYFNFWLFPLIALVRLCERMLPETPKDTLSLHMPAAPINRLLTWVFASEAWLLARTRLPFGVSIAVMAERPNQP